MMKIKLSKLLLIALMFNLSVSANIFAQEDSSEPEEIIVRGKVLYSDQVTALKTPIPIIDVPQTLSIITDADILKQGFRSIGDIVRYTPGVNTSQGEGHRDSVVFRGVRSTADFYLDGVRDDVQYYRSLYNLEQVEILRGPNALLFGRGGTGGIINRVTKKPVLNDVFGSFDMGADTFGAFDFAVDYNIQTGESSALRINFHSDTLENHRDFYDGDRYGFNPTLRVQISPQTTLDLSYEHADHERFIDRGVPTLNGEPVEAFEDIVFGDTDTNLQTLRADIFRANVSHEFSDTRKGNLVFQYSDFQKMYKNYYASGYSGGDTFTADGYKDPTERTNLIISGNIVNEFQTGSAKHTLLVGAEIIDTENENYRYNTFFITTEDDNEVFNISRPINFGVNAAGVRTYNDFTADLKSSTESDIEVTSFYIQDQIDVSDNFKIMLGGRFDSFDITVRDIKNGTSESREDEEVSPRAGLIFKPQENLSLYVSYSESFLPRSGEQYKKLDASGAALDPDVYKNTEFGYKYDINDALTFTAAIFDSESTRAEKDNETGEMNEIRGLEVEGYEVELSGDIDDQNNLTFGYTSLDGVTSKGTKQPRELPNQMLSLWYSYQANETFGFGLGVTHQAESFIKDTTNGSTGPALPDYTRVDFALHINASDNDVVRVHIENLTDELYFPHSHSTHQASVGESLSARVSYLRRF